jgi:hypothetical protein
MARPTKLTEAVLAKAREYVDTGWSKQKHAVPMIEGLALYIGTHRVTVREWVDNPPKDANENETDKQFKLRISLHKRFSDIVRDLDTIQALELGSGALKNKLNAKTANMMLSKHGYVERKETDITSQGQSVVPVVRIIDERPRDTDTE